MNVVGMEDITPPIRDLLPRLTPVLKNRHEKVQENCIDLIGRIVDRAAAQVSAREWMRICFELLELLKAPRKSIRRAAVSTFGFIAKAIGPQDVLHTLLNNLKVQDRQNRVCTTVAIAIVAETCSPLTVLPALMSEYRSGFERAEWCAQGPFVFCSSTLAQWVSLRRHCVVSRFLFVVHDVLKDLTCQLFSPLCTLLAHGFNNSQRLHLCNYTIDYESTPGPRYCA